MHEGELGQFADLRGGGVLEGLRPQYTLNRRSLLIDTMAYKHKISKENNIVWH